MKEELPYWNDKPHKGFLIIQNHDLQAGFGALMLYALNGIRKAQERNLIPVIDFNADNCPYFYDKKTGEDIWGYYFESVSPYSHEQVQNWLKEGQIQPDQVQYVNSKESAETHQYDPDRLATFWAWKAPNDPAQWMAEKRALGRSFVKEYIKPKASILDKTEKLVASTFKADFIIGVHIRGTDFAYAQPTPVSTYFEAIDQLILQKELTYFQIYVATDQQQFLEAFVQRYQGKVISQGATRSTNHIAPFRSDQVSGYLKGEEVLLDVLALSKCQHVLKGAAAVGELALWFTKLEDITDFALQSAFNTKEYGDLESTYAQLNIGHKTRASLSLHKTRERLVRRSIESRLGKALYTRFRWVRKLLRH